jgi:hypothetical protein
VRWAGRWVVQEDFWGNMGRYAKYAVTVVFGTGYVIIKPLFQYLKCAPSPTAPPLPARVLPVSSSSFHPVRALGIWVSLGGGNQRYGIGCAQELPARLLTAAQAGANVSAAVYDGAGVRRRASRW